MTLTSSQLDVLRRLFEVGQQALGLADLAAAVPQLAPFMEERPQLVDSLLVLRVAPGAGTPMQPRQVRRLEQAVGHLLGLSRRAVEVVESLEAPPALRDALQARVRAISDLLVEVEELHRALQAGLEAAPSAPGAA